MKLTSLISILITSVLAFTTACDVGKKSGADEDSSSSPSDDKNETDETDETSDTGTLAINDDVPVDLTGYSMESMPSIREAGEANPNSLEVGSSLMQTVGDPVDSSYIQGIFKYECYWGDPSDSDGNYCPKSITDKLISGEIAQGVSGESKGELEFSDHSLIGMIHHAKSYFEGGYKYNSGAIMVEPSSVKFIGNQDENKNELETETDAFKFVVKIDDFFNRYKPGKSSKFTLSHKPKEGEYRYGAIPSMKYFNQMENNIYQSYLTMDEEGKKPRAYALNNVKNHYSDSSNCAGDRSILLVNYANDRFILKKGDNSNVIVIAGKGGFDFEKNEWKVGSYYAYRQSTDEGNTDEVWQACVDNKSQTIVESSTECTEAAALFDGGPFDPGAFLDFNEVEKKDLANFMPFVSNRNAFTEDQIPLECSDTKYFADKVTYTEAKNPNE